MVSDFLLLWSCFNLAPLLPEKQKELANLRVPFKVGTYFEYEKLEERYWTGENLLNKSQNKALPTRKALYLSYKLLFIFDNATSYAIYAKDALQAENMNKSSDSQ